MVIVRSGNAGMLARVLKVDNRCRDIDEDEETSGRKDISRCLGGGFLDGADEDFGG